MIYKFELILSVEHESNIFDELLLQEKISEFLKGKHITDEKNSDAIFMTIEDAGVFNMKAHYLNEVKK